MIYPILIFSLLFLMACETGPINKVEEDNCIDDGVSVQCADPNMAVWYHGVEENSHD